MPSKRNRTGFCQIKLSIPYLHTGFCVARCPAEPKSSSCDFAHSSARKRAIQTQNGGAFNGHWVRAAAEPSHIEVDRRLSRGGANSRGDSQRVAVNRIPWGREVQRIENSCRGEVVRNVHLWAAREFEGYLRDWCNIPNPIGWCAPEVTGTAPVPHERCVNNQS